MKVRYIWEHNGDDSLIYAENFTGAFVRGESKHEALAKFEDEIRSYVLWRDDNTLAEMPLECEMSSEHISCLNICDADSDVLFDSEKSPLKLEEYITLKTLALKSAKSFQTLYDSIPDKNSTCLLRRKTFYGETPVTAAEMYAHTKSVNAYYFGEIGIPASNEPDILTCRRLGFEALEQNEDFLVNGVFAGSYGERWSLRKVCRRFVWHDRIHAKAMWRMAKRVFNIDQIENPFYFSV